MPSVLAHARRTVCATLLTLTLFVPLASAQNPPPNNQADDVLRINTELVQTGVTVVDKQGHFVDGLKPEQFELRVDGTPVKPSFFERVIAGTAHEEKAVEAASRAASNATAPAAGASYRGRTVIFFVDDLHLSLDSLGRTRSAVTHFLENEMTPRDQVAAVSASGQIGFLQQLTDNKSVLREALARIKYVPNTTIDRDQPPMTEYIAIRIQNGDREAADFYADKIVEGFTTKRLTARQINREAVVQMVKDRANYILFGVEAVTRNTLDSLDSMLRTAGQTPGRKLVFFISDGFYLDTRKGPSALNNQVERVIDTATRTGSVIYTIDARGLFAPISDATNERPSDTKGRIDRASVGEASLSQDGLSALAGDTGGRFLKNQNYFEGWVSRMLDETSNYYLLAWKPVTEEQKGGKFKRVEVSVVGRPDLTVRLPRGFIVGGPPEPAAKSAAAATDSKTPAAPPAKGTETELVAALNAPKKGLPTQLSVSFLDVPGSGPVLTTSMQMATDVLGYGADGKQTASIDLAGVVLNDQGKQAGGFKNRISVNPLPPSAGAVENPGVIYNHKIPLKPGLYQVRVAARDAASGRVGSAVQWIEIPDLSQNRLTLSSLLIGGQLVGSNQKGGADAHMQFSVDRRFKRGSHMNFLTIIYNAARDAGAPPDLEAQIQISRDGQPIVNSPPRKVSVDPSADAARIPYGADIALQTLPAGRYLLQVKITDRKTNSSVTQQATFDIE